MIFDVLEGLGGTFSGLFLGIGVTWEGFGGLFGFFWVFGGSLEDLGWSLGSLGEAQGVTSLFDKSIMVLHSGPDSCLKD